MKAYLEVEMPKCCYDCFALNDSGDYHYCRITGEQRGYTFNARQDRMPHCPMMPINPTNPCDTCGVGWGRISTDGCESCHSNCSKFIEYIRASELWTTIEVKKN